MKEVALNLLIVSGLLTLATSIRLPKKSKVSKRIFTALDGDSVLQLSLETSEEELHTFTECSIEVMKGEPVYAYRYAEQIIAARLKDVNDIFELRRILLEVRQALDIDITLKGG